MSMHSQKTSIETITVPSFGACTLLPLDSLPEQFRSYEKLLVTAHELDLKELPALTHTEVQFIFKELVHKLAPLHIGSTYSITVWLSGVHCAYPYIDTALPNQTMEPCISAMDMFFLDEQSPMDMYITEVSTRELREIEFQDIVYCLFLGI